MTPVGSGTKKFLWAGAIVPVLLFYFLFDPIQTRWMPQCVFQKFTGLQCMGCGSQRMLHALLHGNLSEAFHANAVVFCAIPLILFLLFVEIYRKRFPRLYMAVHRRWVIILLAAVLAAWLPIRNIFNL